jgi:hypothetical protein
MLTEGQKASSKCPHPEFASSILKPAAMDRTMSVRSAGRTSSSAVMANGASTKTEALFWLTPAVQCHQPPWPCITFSTAKSLTHRSERMSLRAFCAQWRVWSPWPRIGQRSSNDTARHGSRAVHAGSAPGNARCAYGRIFNGFPIRCSDISACRRAWCMRVRATGPSRHAGCLRHRLSPARPPQPETSMEQLSGLEPRAGSPATCSVRTGTRESLGSAQRGSARRIRQGSRRRHPLHRPSGTCAARKPRTS